MSPLIVQCSSVSHLARLDSPPLSSALLRSLPVTPVHSECPFALIREDKYSFSTSQLFSNVYLNLLDQYVKRKLRCRHYGRYVDDFYVVSADKEFLLEVAERVKEMLQVRLHLEINDGKTKVLSIWHGVDFLGAYVKPYRQYASRQMVMRMREKLRLLPKYDAQHVQASLQSYEGLLSHGKNFLLWQKLLTITYTKTVSRVYRR